MESAPRIPPDAICYICRNDGSAQGLVSACGCHGGDGIAHVTCLVRMARMAVIDFEEVTDAGGGIEKWWKCFECLQVYHGALERALQCRNRTIRRDAGPRVSCVDAAEPTRRRRGLSESDVPVSLPVQDN